MSQEKVERYKEEKKNRKKIMAQEKRKRVFSALCGWVIALAFVGWIGVSFYDAYQDKKPLETIYTDLSSLNDYFGTLEQ